MNLGLTDLLKSNFINTKPVVRPKTLTIKISDPNWLSGFISGEGNFDVKIQKSKTNKLGFSVRLRFRIGQHIKDLNLIELLNQYFCSGSIYKYSSSLAVSLTISNFAVITKTIIPLLNKYPLIGVKQNDYLDWCQIAKLIFEGKHLTSEGLDLIRSIKAGINRGRKTKNF
jgi:hypothetical protein